MVKEITICIIIIFFIIMGDFFTLQYIKNVTEEVSNNMQEIRQLMEKNKSEIDNQEIKDKFNKLNKEWKKDFYKLAFFIEHTELEKIETSLTSLYSSIETNEYKDAIEKINTTTFLLNHIKDKYSVNLQNIF